MGRNSGSTATAQALQAANRAKLQAQQDSYASRQLAAAGAASQRAQQNAFAAYQGNIWLGAGATGASIGGAFPHPDFPSPFTINMYGSPPPPRILPGYNGEVSVVNYFYKG